MKRYIKYIFLSLLTCFLASSCIEELDSPKPVVNSDLTTLVPRVKSFTNQYVTKGTGYTSYESKIEKLAVLVFGAVADEQGKHKLIYTQQSNGSSLTLNKSELNIIANSTDLSGATIVMFANVGLSDIKKKNADGTFTAISQSLTLEELDSYSIHLNTDPVVVDLTDENFHGFPMKGIATNINLTAASSDPIVVNLQILYAKINFEIGVAAGTENQNYEGVTPSFTPAGYSVTNVPTSTIVKSLNDDEANGAVESTPVGTTYKHTGSENDPSKTISSGAATFTFYMAESRYNHGGTDGIYPANLPDENKQQYKPLLATNGTGSPATGMATYVTVNGTYKDYRGTNWTVNYKVYLGKNNYDNFHVDRNSEYTNILTIKGIRNNNSYGTDDVWIDHRVDVTASDPSKHVKITRETLLDSHIEVRPLRVDLSGSNYVAAAIYLPSYPLDNEGRIINDINTPIVSWGQVQEVPGGNNENWIAIENNNGTIARGKLYCANGKRKYFTTSLIEELHLQNDSEDYGIKEDSQGHKYLPLSDGDCAWVYFDENLTSNKRRARIDVVFYKQDGSAVTESYDIYQAGLKTVGGYMIEEYEEYLHSYDSDDKYNLLTSPTDYTQTGLPWGMLIKTESGFNGYKLSDSHVVKSVREGYELLSERYDYYHSNDGSYYIFQKNDDASWSEVDKSTNTGLKFTARASKKDNMTIIDMGTRPTSAYQYCLSKNKFNESLSDDKHSMMIHWYLPDVYEMKSILNAAEADETLKDFTHGAYYWSSQPSFTTSLLQIADETADYARAVSLNEDNFKDIYRNEPHRIRCVRSTQGEYADMAERVPDGLGGLIRIPMTVKDNGFFNHKEWFTSLGKVETHYPSTIPNYRFPKGDTDSGSRTEADKDFGGQLIGSTHYYSKNPLAIENWGKIDASSIGWGVYYSMIHDSKWPGLTNKNTTPLAGDVLEAVAAVFRVDALAILETTEKTLERSETIRYGNKISAMPADVSSVPLDHNEGTSNLSIAFSSGTNKSKSPQYQYYYENVSSATKRVWHKYWNVPTYNTKTFPPQDPLNYPAPPRSVTFDRGDVLDEIDDVINGFLNEVANKKAELVGDPIITPVTTSSIYSYSRSSDAKTAGTNYFDNTINASNEYTLISVDTSPQTITLCNYSYTYQKYKRNFWWSEWKTDGNPITATGSLTEQFYTYVINYKNIEGTFYRYQSGTGGWATEVELPSESVTVTAEQANVDALTLYGANTFTITAKSGYNIRSIKVNYSGSNFVTSYGLGGLTYSRYLRLVDANKSLPDRNKQPSNMTYSPDGDKGWFKWSSSGDDVVSSVTLKLVAYSATTSVNVIGQTIPSTFEYTSPDEILIGEKGLDTPLIIDSFEIRIEEVEQ